MKKTRHQSSSSSDSNMETDSEKVDILSDSEKNSGEQSETLFSSSKVASDLDGLFANSKSKEEVRAEYKSGVLKTRKKEIKKDEKEKSQRDSHDLKTKSYKIRKSEEAIKKILDTAESAESSEEEQERDVTNPEHESLLQTSKKRKRAMTERQKQRELKEGEFRDKVEGEPTRDLRTIFVGNVPKEVVLDKVL